MQQLQSLYRGDGSPSLAQIFGMQYQPQQAISQAANTAVASGMSTGAQIKATEMNNATQMAINNAQRQESRRQFNLTNTLQGRIAGETQRHNMASEALTRQATDFQTGGSIAAEDQKALGAIQGQITEMEMFMNGLDKNDPNYADTVELIKGRIRSLKEGANKASLNKGGAQGFATQTGRMYDPKAGSFTLEGGKLVRAAGLTGTRAAPSAPAAPVSPAATAANTEPYPSIGGSPTVRDVGSYTGIPSFASNYTLGSTFSLASPPAAPTAAPAAAPAATATPATGSGPVTFWPPAGASPAATPAQAASGWLNIGP